jgi:hypothetical protein
LADILWPVLQAKCERELAAGRVETPALRIAMEVRQLVGRLSCAFGLEVPEGYAEE